MEKFLKKQLVLCSLLFCWVLFSSFHQKNLTEDEVYCYIKSIGIKHPEIVLRQAIIESGHFTSKLARTKNNIFGFRNRNYLSYSNWKACVDYYKVWQEKRYKDTTQDYYVFLQKINYTGNKNGAHYKNALQAVKLKTDMICN